MAVAAKAVKSLAFQDRLKRAQAFHAKGFELKHAQLVVQATKGDLAAIVKLADKLLVDPRWLAIGEPSPAAEAAMKRVRLWSFFSELAEPPQRALLACLELTPQPDPWP
jgi:hypothetical protein